MRRTLAGLAAGAVLALGAVDVATAAFPGTNGRIAVGVERWRLPDPCRRDIPHGCEPEVYAATIETIRPDGGGRRVVRAFPVELGSGAPEWSPRGRALTFEQGERLAIVRGDGTGWRRLPQLTSGDRAPAWSPDGRRLAFTGSAICCNWLYTVRTDGTGLRRVLARVALAPDWSVTGSIAFVYATGLQTVRPDGSRLRQLRPGYPGAADWSPDGTRIAFSNGGDILTIGADGRNARRVTAGTSLRATDPAWSPDGKWIAFLGNGDVYAIRPNGRGLRRILDVAQPDVEDPARPWVGLSAPSWQPLTRGG